MPEKGEANMLHAFDLGLAKIMSKMGISVLDSYRSAHLFDILGLDREVVELCFEGTPSPISGIGFAELEVALRDRWSAAQDEDSQPALVNAITRSRSRPRPPRSSRSRRGKPKPYPTMAGFASAKTIVLSRTAGSRRR
jgi:glutamate synthase domain-containing protein 2